MAIQSLGISRRKWPRQKKNVEKNTTVPLNKVNGRNDNINSIDTVEFDDSESETEDLE